MSKRCGQAHQRSAHRWVRIASARSQANHVGRLLLKGDNIVRTWTAAPRVLPRTLRYRTLLTLTDTDSACTVRQRLRAAQAGVVDIM